MSFRTRRFNLELHYNEIPTCLYDCSDIEELNLKGKGISTLPSWLIQLENLKILRVEQTQITHIPSFLFHLPSLEYLSLQRNQIQTFDYVTANYNLETLLLGHNQISDLPKEIWNLASLKMLGLQNNQITSIAPLPNGLIHELKRINCDHNQMESLSWLQSFPHLTHLSVDNNKLHQMQKSTFEQAA